MLTLTRVVPMIFLQLMGLFQLYTALAGGVLALIITTFISKKND
jgi:Flp pilus assembly protein protease CpaA